MVLRPPAGRPDPAPADRPAPRPRVVPTLRPPIVAPRGACNARGRRRALEPVATLPIRSPVTAIDISANGRWLAVLTVTGPTLFRIDGDPAAAAAAKPAGVFVLSPKMEAACLVPEGLLATTEDRDVYLFRFKDFGLEDAAGADAAE